MRRSLFVMICFVFITQTATSQFTITPRLGVESSRTLVSVNNKSFFAPLSSQFSPLAGLRFDYTFKKGHGIFGGISTSNTIVDFKFADPETGATNYFASRSTTQLRLEMGYQFTTKPVFLRNNSTSKTSKAATQKSKSSSQKEESSAKQGCASYTRHSCCSERSSQSCSPARSAKTGTKTMMSVRFQPQVGFASIPSPQTDFTNKLEGTQTSYTYNAGNWNTALISGMGFEFAKGRNKLFQVNIQYLKGIGNLDDKTLTTQSGTKLVQTNFASRLSAWSLSVGVPFTLNASKAGKTKSKSIQKNYQQPRRRCGQANFGCGARI